MASTTALKDKIPLIVAIILGLFAIVAIQKYIHARVSIPEGQKERIMIAKTRLKANVEINAGELDTRIVPANTISSVNITVPLGDSAEKRAQIESIKMTLVGRTPSRDIAAGEPIYWNDLQDTEAETLSNVLKKNMRAVAVGVDQVTAVGFNIAPGDHVDVLVTMQPKQLNLFAGKLTRVGQGADDTKLAPTQDDNPGPVTRILMQDAEVLAVGRNYSSSAYFRQNDTYPTITLEATVEEAVMLTHARAQGEISFVLRQRKSLHRLKSPGFVEVSDESLKSNINLLDNQRALELEQSSLIDEKEKRDALQRSALMTEQPRKVRKAHEEEQDEDKAKSLK